MKTGTRGQQPAAEVHQEPTPWSDPPGIPSGVPAPTYAASMACPGCGGTAWNIGRAIAECGGCGYPVALARQV